MNTLLRAGLTCRDRREIAWLLSERNRIGAIKYLCCERGMRVHEARLIVDHWGGSRSPEIRPSERIEAASLRAAHLWVVVASLLWLAGLVLLVSMLWAWFGHHALA